MAAVMMLWMGLALAQAPAEAQHVASWDVLYTLHDLDAEARAVLTLGDEVPDELLVPLRPSAGVQELVAAGPKKPVAVEVVQRGGEGFFLLDRTGLVAGSEVVLTWRQERFFGPEPREEEPHHLLAGELAFVNTSMLTYDAVTLAAMAPKGRLVHMIRSTTPKLNPKSPEIPYYFENDRSTRQSEVGMRCKAIGPGERCEMSWVSRPWRRSWFPWLLGGLLSAGWLLGFRSLLKAEDEE